MLSDLLFTLSGYLIAIIAIVCVMIMLKKRHPFFYKCSESGCNFEISSSHEEIVTFHQEEHAGYHASYKEMKLANDRFEEVQPPLVHATDFELEMPRASRATS